MLVDSHCHLDFDVFDEDREAVVERALAAGVGLMVTISTRVRRFDRIRAIAEAHERVYCSIGTHPHQAGEEIDITAADLLAHADHPKVVAIGEAGLDYFYDHAPRDAQLASFRQHIAAARECGLPLIIHARDADADMAAVLEEESARGRFPFVLHCFSSGKALAATGIRLGGHVSFSGILTFRNSPEIRDIARALPRDRLLVETDAPFLSPTPLRGKRNEPAHVVHTARCLAETLDMPFEELAETTTANFLRLFSKVPAVPPAGQ